MNSSILITIKKLLGIGVDQTAFDMDIIVFINNAFMALNQIGVGPEKPFSIVGDSESWSDFTNDISKFESVKTYVYLKVRKVFDPSASATVAEAMNATLEECEWRLHVQGNEERRGFI